MILVPGANAISFFVYIADEGENKLECLSTESFSGESNISKHGWPLNWAQCYKTCLVRKLRISVII